MAQNEVNYKVRIARNKQGVNGEAIKIKFGSAVIPRTGFDRCFVGIRNNRIYFKFFKGLPTVFNKFDDSKVFRVQQYGNMPGITVTSKRFLKHFSGFEGEYEVIDWLDSEPHFFVIDPSNRHNFTNLYKNTSTTVTQKEEADERPAVDLDSNEASKEVVEEPRNETSTGAACVSPDSSQEGTERGDIYAWMKKIHERRMPLKDVRALFTDIVLSVYFGCLKDQDNVTADSLKNLLLESMDVRDSNWFCQKTEQMLKESIVMGKKDLALLIFDAVPKMYELTR